MKKCKFCNKEIEDKYIYCYECYLTAVGNCEICDKLLFESDNYKTLLDPTEKNLIYLCKSCLDREIPKQNIKL